MKHEIRGHTAFVTIDNPPANTWTPESLRALETLVARAQRRSHGLRDGDHRQPARNSSPRARTSRPSPGDKARRARTSSRASARRSKRCMNARFVTIAAMNGYAMGGGLECALSCDIRIAESHAQMALPEPAVGLLPAGCGTQMLPWLVGEGWAKRMILTNERVDAATALRIGLVQEVVDKGKSLAAATAMAERVATLSPRAVEFCKKPHPQRPQRHPARGGPRPRARALRGPLRLRRHRRGRERVPREAQARMEERLSARRTASFSPRSRSGAATVTLNRPAALNALSLRHAEGPRRAGSTAWERDERVAPRRVARRGRQGLLRGRRHPRRSTRSSRSIASGIGEFFEIEYALDYRIHTYPKTIVALMDGIVMGGGMGISQGDERAHRGRAHEDGDARDRHRPLSRRGRELLPLARAGRARNLPGPRGPDDPRRRRALLWARGRLHARDGRRSAELPALRDARSTGISPHDSVAAIVESLRGEKDPRFAAWAATTLDALAKRSPTMLCVTLEQLRRGAKLSLADCFRMELNLIHACFDQGDIIEGIRALLVDKDNKPRWQRSRIDDVTRADVDAFFAPRWTAGAASPRIPPMTQGTGT